MKRWLILFLSVILVLTGCKKSYYETYLEEQEKAKKTQAQVWLYGDTADQFKQKLEFYNNYYDPDITIVEFKESEWDLTQFQTKLQAEIMSGTGPDFIYCNSEVAFADVYKSIQAGTFQSFDDIISDWDTEQYYTQTIEACRHTDGKVYIFPLSINMHGIVTTKENLTEYDLTLEDFSDFDTTLDTLLRLWEECDGQSEKNVNADMPSLALSISEIFDYENGITALGNDKTNSLLQKYERVRNFQKKNQYCYNNIWNDNGTTVITSTRPVYRKLLSGTQILEVTSTVKAYRSPLYIDNSVDVLPTAEDLEKIVFIPLRDTDGLWIGEIQEYLLFSAHSQHTETIHNLLEVLMFDDRNVANYGISPSKVHTLQDLMSYLPINKTETITDANGFATLADIPALMKTPMSLSILTPLHKDYEIEIRVQTDQGVFEFEDLAYKLNIYLSE